METKNWLNAEEAARYLGLTRRALYARVYRRQLPAHKLGDRSLRFDPRELDLVLGIVTDKPIQLLSEVGKDTEQ